MSAFIEGASASLNAALTNLQSLVNASSDTQHANHADRFVQQAVISAEQTLV